MSILFDYDKLLRDNFTRIRIALPNGTTITGISQSKLTLSGSNDFTNPYELGAQESLSKALNLTTQTLNQIFGKNIPNIQLKSVAQTIQTWSGSGQLPLNVQILLLATREEDDIRTNVAELLATTYPSIKGELSPMVAPLGYRITRLKDGRIGASGTVTLEVGTWFRLPGLLMKDVSFEISQEVIASGAPLYATGTLSLTPYKQLSAENVRGMLKQSGGQPIELSDTDVSTKVG